MNILNIISWILQISVAIFFTKPAKDNLCLSASEFIKRHQLKPGQSVVMNRIIGLLQLCGIFGIILPKALNIFPILTPVSAIGFCLMMIFASFIHKNDVNKRMFFTVLFVAIVNLVIIILNKGLLKF